jgi:hypothetical protein
VNSKYAKLLLHYCISKFYYIEGPAYLSMPKFLAGCHYNEEEISRHLKKKYRILTGPNEWQQVCNLSNPGKIGRSCEGMDFSWLSSKVSRTLIQILAVPLLANGCISWSGLASTPEPFLFIHVSTFETVLHNRVVMV